MSSFYNFALLLNYMCHCLVEVCETKLKMSLLRPALSGMASPLEIVKLGVCVQ